MPEKREPNRDISVPFSEQNQLLKERLDIIRRNAINAKRYGDLNSEIIKIVNNLKKKYSDWERYEVLHVLAGSSLWKSKVSENYYKTEDFPGEDSVVKLIKELEQGFKSKQE